MEKKTIIWSACSLTVGLAIGVLVGITCFNRGPKPGPCGSHPGGPCHQHCMVCPPQHFHGDSTMMPPPGCHKHHKAHGCKQHRQHADKPCCHKQQNVKQ